MHGRFGLVKDKGKPAFVGHHTCFKEEGNMGNWGKYNGRKYSDTLLKRKIHNQFCTDEEAWNESVNYDLQEVEEGREDVNKTRDYYKDSFEIDEGDNEIAGVDEAFSRADASGLNFNDAYMVFERDDENEVFLLIENVMRQGYEALIHHDFERFLRIFSSRENIALTLMLLSFRRFVFEQEWNRYAITYCGMVLLFLDDPDQKIITRYNPYAVHMVTRAVICFLIAIRESRGILEEKNTQKIVEMASSFQYEEDYTEMLNQATEVLRVIYE